MTRPEWLAAYSFVRCSKRADDRAAGVIDSGRRLHHDPPFMALQRAAGRAWDAMSPNLKRAISRPGA